MNLFSKIFFVFLESYTDAGTIVGIVFGVLVGLFVIALGVGFYLKRKQGGKGQTFL